MTACRYCTSHSENDGRHVYGERKCCPDCDHRPRCVEINGARVQVEGMVPEPLVQALAALADAVQQAFGARPRNCVCDSVGADRREHIGDQCVPRYITGG